MALRVVEQAGLTDVGRQREANEDNLVLASPVFAVADGMGGARAGEVASEIAAETFRDPRDPSQTPEQQLEHVAKEANRRIYDLSLRDQSRRGMGTTLTATLVDGDAVSVGILQQTDLELNDLQGRVRAHRGPTLARIPPAC